MYRVKFYSTHDLSVGIFLERIEDVLARYDENEKITNINDAIERYNIQQFFENHIISKNWTPQQADEYTKIVQRFPKSLGSYFSGMKSRDICDAFDAIEVQYFEDFWKLLEKYRIFNRISSTDFVELMRNERFTLKGVLICRQIVNRFSDEIILYMEHNPETAELLIGYYFEKREREKDQIYFPDGLTADKKTAILDAYIEAEPNLNYLRLIVESNGTKELPLSDRIKRKAKKKYLEQLNRLLGGSDGFKYGVDVRFSQIQEDEQKYEIREGTILSLTYSEKWIDENLDYPTLLNNFIYLFGYTDLQFRSLHVRTEIQMGVIERSLGIHGKREYHTGIKFNQIQMLAQLQMSAYCAQLEKRGINLEEIFRWFFEEYLSDEFNASGFRYHAASAGTSFLEKCRNIAPEIDSILKQFKLWCEEGRVDQELMQMSTEHILIQNIPSLLERKYVYPCGDDCQTATHLLFSEQSLIRMIPDLEENCDSFDSLIRKRSVHYDEFLEYQRPSVDWLLNYGLIQRDAEGRIIPCSYKVKILNQLYRFEVFCFSYAGKYRAAIEELRACGLVEFGVSLFSKPEQDYYNYLMNKSTFDNGLDLRNRYIHGTQSDNALEHKEDYYHFLRIMVLIIIKINEEFCLTSSANDE